MVASEDRLQRVGADAGVALDDRSLLWRQKPWLEENAIGNSHLADVVERRGKLEIDDPLVRQVMDRAQLLGQDTAVGRDPFKVFAGVGVAAFGEFGQSEDEGVARGS